MDYADAVAAFFVPRDESDNDPAKFGFIIHDAAPAM